MRTTKRSRATVTALAVVLIGAGVLPGTAKSFFVGGRTIHSDAVSGTAGGMLGTGNGGSISVDQMYVQYQKGRACHLNTPMRRSF